MKKIKQETLLIEENLNQNEGVITLTEEQQKFLWVKSKVYYMITDDILNNLYVLQFILSEFEEVSKYYLKYVLTIEDKIRGELLSIIERTKKVTIEKLKILKCEFENFPKEFQKSVNEFKSRLIEEQYEKKIEEEFEETFTKTIKKLGENLKKFTNISNEIYQFILEIEKRKNI